MYMSLLPPFDQCILTTSQDCWALLDRDPNTNEQIPDPSRFPNGIKSLADQIHSMGLKIGIFYLLIRFYNLLTVYIATLAPRPAKDIPVLWVTKLSTLLPGSLGVLIVSFTTSIITIQRSFESYLTPHRSEIR